MNIKTRYFKISLYSSKHFLNFKKLENNYIISVDFAYNN